MAAAVIGRRRTAEPAQIVGTAACAVDADDLPLADNDGVVGAVLVDPGAEAGRAELETPQTV